jgi:hypothetical protein
MTRLRVRVRYEGADGFTVTRAYTFRRCA